MTTRRELLKWSLAALAGGGTYASAPREARADGTLAIIVARESPIQELSRFELKKLYLGSPISDPSGDRIVPFNQVPSSPDRVAFEQRVLEMSSEELARYWIDRKIRGQGGAPKAISPADLLQKVVSRLPHSVAYVNAANVLPEVRVIPIDGRLPGDGAYGLLA